MRHKHKRPTKSLTRKETTRKGTIDRSIIGESVEGQRSYVLHATKGYRSYRVPA